MKYQYRIQLRNDDYREDFLLKKDDIELKLGTTSDCKLRIDRESVKEDFYIQLIYKNNSWYIECSQNICIVDAGEHKNNLELQNGINVQLKYSDSDELLYDMFYEVYLENSIPKYDSFVRLSSDRDIIVGDIQSADLSLHGDFVEKDNVVLSYVNGALSIKSFMSNFDVCVNDKSAYNGMDISSKSFITIAGCTLYFDTNKIFFDSSFISSETMEVNPVIKNKNFNYPMFVRNTRKKIQVNTEEIPVLDPPTKPTKPELNIVTSLMPTLAMFALTVVLRGFMSDSGGSFVIFSICSMGLGVVTSVLSIFMSRRGYRKELAKRKEDYSMYSRRKEEEIIKLRNEELENLRETYYSTEDDIIHFKDFDAKLFDRIPEDDDFLDVYLGTGRVKSERQIDYKRQETMDVEDNICQIPFNLATQYKYIENAPIVAKLKEANAIGIVGDNANNNIILENIIIDLMARQYYGDVNLYLLLDHSEIDTFSWIRLLPYFNNSLGFRNIVSDNDSKNYIFEYLYKELNFREGTECDAPWNVILIKDEHGIKSHPISKYIEKASSLNTVFVFFEEKEELLPLYCSQIIRVNSNCEGEVFYTDDKTEVSRFRFIQVNDAAKNMLMNRIAPIECEEISLEGSLRKSISLFELLDIYAPEDLDLQARWEETKIYESMAVPLGVNVKDEIVYLNLHEKFHGPHGLVAGTTGSGKSEILQSYILGAASLFQPTEIGFLIIDFKGGGMVNQFKDLPHLLGAITNIDGKAIDRSLKSIKAELLKRQEYFSKADVNHIDKYIKLYKEGKVTEALPHLVIIVDEFAELKAEQPEFMKELISAARIGRSLGVHLILATQKPAGQVDDQIWSNSKFKLCLKVQTPEDSNEVLKSPLAAEIKEPGRAYLQVGNNEIFELFQSGFSGAPEKTDKNAKKFKISEVDFNGNKQICYERKPAKALSNVTQLDALVKYISDYCNKNRIETLDEICLPALKTNILCPNQCGEKTIDMLCPIGIYDDPDHQYQGIASIETGNQNTFIIGSSQYGKTNLLMTIIRNLTSIYTPDEVNLYVLDFGSMVLKNFENLNHIGGVVVASEDERVKNLFKYLYEQVEYRREKLLSVGVSSFSSYKEAGYTDLPQIIVLVDNLTALRELYFENEDELLPLTREGLSVGISFVVANVGTAQIGYRYLANFASKIALFSNDETEYSNLFGRNRIVPDEIPGRSILEIDKEVYECQTFIAFEGEKEIDRIASMRDFISRRNDENNGMKAIQIPEIPDLLSSDYIEKNYSVIKDHRLILGLDYDSVSPAFVDLMKHNILSICGREKSGKANAIMYIIKAFAGLSDNSQIEVFDNYKKKLESSANYDGVTYHFTTDDVVDAIKDLEHELEFRYNALVSGVDYDESYRVIIINNEDAINIISNDMDAMDAIKMINGKFKMLNAFIVLSQIPNSPIQYGAPELLRYIKETPNMLFFDELDNCKPFDVPLSIVRNKGKKIQIGDGFHIAGNEINRIKTPYSMLS